MEKILIPDVQKVRKLYNIVHAYSTGAGSCSVPMVSALDSGVSSPISSHGLGHFVVYFFGQVTLPS